MRKWYTVSIYDKCRYGEHRTAHHEAGHAVIGRVLGLEGGLVTIVKDDIGDGRAAFRASGTVEARIVMSLAGREAESVFGFDNADNEMTEGAGYDRSHIGFLCAEAGQVIDIERLRRKTRRLVQKHRASIDRVAHALLERKTLQGDELDALMGS